LFLKLETSGKNTKYLKILHASDIKLDIILPLLKKILSHAKKVSESALPEKHLKKVSKVIKKITIENPKSIMKKKKPVAVH
jgi:hypothetical protein